MIYLIRHTTPAVAKGLCYGQTDLDITESFEAESTIIRQHLPDSIGLVYSSPLRRCVILANRLFPGLPLRTNDALMEIHCGEWEMRAWDDLPPEEVDPWMKDFVHVRIPGGESYIDLHQRVSRCWDLISREEERAGTGEPAVKVVEESAGAPAVEAVDAVDPSKRDIAIVAHGGVIRSILAGITGTPLVDSFKTFSLHYGCVIRLFESNGRWEHETLFNQAPAEKEQHKPKAFYR